MIQTFGQPIFKSQFAIWKNRFSYTKKFFGMKELFSVGANCVMLKLPDTRKHLHSMVGQICRKKQGELAAVQPFGFRQQRPRNPQPQPTGSGNDK